MSVLAIDLGTTTGWAMALGLEPVVSGTWHLKGGRFEGGGMRFLRFRRLLEEVQRLQPVGEVVFEEVRRHAGVDAAHIYGGLLGQLSAWCEEHTIPYEGVPVGTIKRFATGRGNAGKPDMMAAAREAGFAPSDDNEADAIHLLRYWAAHKRGEA